MSLYQQFFSVKDSFSIVLHMDFRFIVTVLPAETPHCGISCSKNTKKPKLPPRKSHCSDLCLVRNNHGFSKGKIRSVRPSVSPYIGPLRLFWQCFARATRHAAANQMIYFVVYIFFVVVHMHLV